MLEDVFEYDIFKYTVAFAARTRAVLMLQPVMHPMLAVLMLDKTTYCVAVLEYMGPGVVVSTMDNVIAPPRGELGAQ